ncbi:MAG: hypothetical protein KBD60_13460, partial [Sterolibacterium sp.]|nr:hypothetical protein [Sterolibacterium sp.]
MMRRFLHFTTFILRTGMVLLLVTCATLAWLAGTTAGLSQLAEWAQWVGNANGGQLQIERVTGHLWDRFAMGRLHWQSAELDLEIDGLQLDWSPLALAQGRLEIARLTLVSVRVHTPPSQTPTPLPADLQWPFGLGVRIGQWQVGRLVVEGHALAQEISGQYDHDGGQHQLNALRLQGGDVAVAGEVRLADHPPFALAGKLQLCGQVEARPLALTLDLNGYLSRFYVNAVATQGVVGLAQAVVIPLALVPYESLHVQVDQLDPAAWHPAAPPARLSLAADFVPEGDGLAGRFTLHNHQPGALDQQRLPLMDLRGHLRWQAGRATFSELVASLSGGGRLLGQGAWRERHLQLELSAHQLDLAKIDSRLRPTRLVGALGASLGADRQAVRVSLRDARYQLEADVTLQGGHLKIPHLKLAAQAARLDLQGEMQLDVPRRFSAAGQLQDFDPSRFAQLPAARLNADWQASGQLAPQPRLEARFRLHDSQIVQQPLQGQGTLSLDWPKIPRMEIELRAGSNRLQVSGAYGQPEDRLQLAVDAAHLDELAGLGLAGGLVGQGVLVGDWRSPQLNLQLSAVALGWRDHFRLAGLKLALNTGPPPAVPLNLDLSIARLDLPERPALLQQFQLTGEGVLAAHRLRVHTEVALAGSNQLTLAIQSGWDATRQRWHGQLLEAAVQAAERARNVRLLQPAAFSLAAQHWQLEPLALSSPLVDGQIHLQGRADAQRMQLEIKADGARIGQVSGELQAAMQGAWSLDKRARWQGGLHVDMADLGWLAEWMGEGWASGGRLQGDVQLAGSPAQPWASGRLRGLDLSLRLPEQGLTLARGALDVELRDNRLQIHRFGFESPLQPPPRALRQVGGESLARLTAQPGRLDMVGEMRFDQPTGVK